MDLVLYIIGFLVVLVWLWLNLLATFSVRHDSTLAPFQKTAQQIIIWVVPFIGSALILHLVWEQYPETIPKSWIPWPFKKLVYGKANAPNPNRNNDESPAIKGALDFHHHYNVEVGGDEGNGD